MEIDHSTIAGKYWLFMLVISYEMSEMIKGAAGWCNVKQARHCGHP